MLAQYNQKLELYETVLKKKTMSFSVLQEELGQEKAAKSSMQSKLQADMQTISSKWQEKLEQQIDQSKRETEELKNEFQKEKEELEADLQGLTNKLKAEQQLLVEAKDETKNKAQRIIALELEITTNEEHLKELESAKNKL